MSIRRLSLDRTYEELKQQRRGHLAATAAQSLDRTYEELKLNTPCKRFISSLGLDRTYEELKLRTGAKKRRAHGVWIVPMRN